MFSDGSLRPRKQGSGGVSKSIKGFILPRFFYYPPFFSRRAEILKILGLVDLELVDLGAFLHLSVSKTFQSRSLADISGL